MKKILFRALALALTMMLAVSLCSCAKKKTSSGNEIERVGLYKVVLEDLVDEYGMPTVTETTFKGVQDFEIIDLNDDGKKELFVVCSKGENNFFSAIYTVEKGEALKVWEADYKDAFSNAYVKKQDGKTCIFLTVSYRNWSSGIIVYEDGEYVNLYDGEEYSEEEQRKYDEAIRHGIGAENDAIVDIHLNRIGLSLEKPWEEIAVFSTGMEVTGTPSDMKRAFRERATECKNKLKSYGIKKNESHEAILSRIPYYGDISKCKMDKDMAKVYAKAIASMEPFYTSYPGESWSREYELCALLADPAGDGMPILITAYLDKYDSYSDEECNEDYGGLYEIQMWEYEKGKATDAKVQKLDYSNGFGEIDGKTYYRSIEFFHDVGHRRTANYYLIEKGTITLKHTVDIYDAYGNSGEEAFFYGDLPGGKTYALTADNLSANGWIEEKYGDFSSWHYVMLNGKNVTSKYVKMEHDEIVGFSHSDEIAHINDLEYHITLYNESAWNVAELLSDFSEN